MTKSTQEQKQRFVTNINPVARVVTWVESVLRRNGHFAAQLSRVDSLSGMPESGVACVGVMKNERPRIEDFLNHYRMLDVNGFVLIDNGSTDGTLEYALEQPDCAVFSTTDSYSASGFGSQWINAAIELHGLGNRWLVVADLDELLVYDQCEKRSLPDLAVLLENAKLDALPCLMLDMYDDGTPERDCYVPGTSMIDASPMFDATGYGREPSLIKSLLPATALAINGGPRARTMFNRTDASAMLPYLHKVPFMKWTPGAGMRTSHEVDPIIRNFSPLRGALLHFKFLDNPELTNKDRLQDLDHWNDNRQQSKYFENLGETAGTTFMFEGSQQYASSQSLVHHGLISKLDWMT
ncbi:MAG: glycosyltransferase family 2 protein [Pseudomonadota bacterium]